VINNIIHHHVTSYNLLKTENEFLQPLDDVRIVSERVIKQRIARVKEIAGTAKTPSSVNM